MLFCDHTIQISSHNNDIKINNFGKIIQKISAISRECYKSNDCDIEDLGHILTILFNMNDKMVKDKNLFEHMGTMSYMIRQTKKLINKKMREGSGRLKEGEQKREFFESDNCVQQYHDVREYIWFPGIKKAKELLRESNDNLKS